jgi:hypothetical protein
MNDILKLNSTVNNKLIKSMLIRANLIAFPGIALITFAGVWLPPPVLNFWGLLLFLLGFALIAAGLIPYKRLLKLQVQPHEIIIKENNVHFAAKGQRSLTIPFSSIDQIKFISEGNTYGIGIFLKKDLEKTVCIHDTSLDIEAFQKDSQKHFDCDLYLPYFHEKSFEKFNSIFNFSEEANQL